MGITQHQHSVATIQMINNLLMLRGNIGRPGAGSCPVRGHSNVQGDRTMGIWEKPPAALLDRLRDVFGFEPPRTPGVDVVESIKLMLSGRGKVFIALGGNFAAATPDTYETWKGAAPVRPHGARHHQAQPQPHRARPRGADPALPGPHRDRRAGRRPAGRDGGGLDEHGAHLVGHQPAGVGAPAVRAGDRRPPGRRHAGRAHARRRGCG